MRYSLLLIAVAVSLQAALPAGKSCGVYLREALESPIMDNRDTTFSATRTAMAQETLQRIYGIVERIRTAQRNIPKLIRQRKLQSAQAALPDGITECRPEVEAEALLVRSAWAKFHELMDRGDGYSANGDRAAASKAYRAARKINRESGLLDQKLKQLQR